MDTSRRFRPDRRRKRLGQHFLTRRSAIAQVVEGISPRPGEGILEVGPGRGALTIPLVACGARVLALELDPALARRLRDRQLPEESLSVLEGDILRVDLEGLLSGWIAGDAEVRVVGNLPYSVASPAVLRLLSRGDLFRDWTLMVQREVADRILAPPGSKLFGVMTLLCACRAAPRRVLELSPSCFSPPPRVHSTLLHFTPKTGIFTSSDQPATFERLVKAAFSARRKMLRNTLAAGLRWPVDRTQAVLAAAGIQGEERPERIPLEGYLDLTRRLAPLA